jgi:hypothetical protein
VIPDIEEIVVKQHGLPLVSLKFLMREKSHSAGVARGRYLS